MATLEPNEAYIVMLPSSARVRNCLPTEYQDVEGGGDFIHRICLQRARKVPLTVTLMFVLGAIQTFTEIRSLVFRHIAHPQWVVC